jgi:hypothetical protein
MPDENAFEWACTALEAATSLDRLEARGTLRLALKASGLDPKQVTQDQMSIVFTRVLPGELEARGVADATSICERLATGLAAQGLQAAAGEAPEDVFARLGGS